MLNDFVWLVVGLGYKCLCGQYDFYLNYLVILQGHYLSATAQMWASTHNDTLHEKMSALVSALSSCQDKIGTGYLSAFPTELFDRLEDLTPVWAPYYTIHKVELLQAFSMTVMHFIHY